MFVTTECTHIVWSIGIYPLYNVYTYNLIIGVNYNLKVLIHVNFMILELLCFNNEEYNFKFKRKQEIFDKF